MAEDPVVFISYRRADASGDAGRLYDSLRRRFGRENVFMDVDSVQPGDDWVDAINRSVEAADVMLAVIGPDWISAHDDAGHRRLDDEGDHVRLEIEAALNADTPVIPLLVEDAAMPKRAQLPASLQPLLRHQGYRLAHQTYGADMQGLVRALRRLKRAEEPDPEPAHKPEPPRPATVEPPPVAKVDPPPVAKVDPPPVAKVVPAPAPPAHKPAPAPVVAAPVSAPVSRPYSPPPPPPPEWTAYSQSQAAPPAPQYAAQPYATTQTGAPPRRSNRVLIAALAGGGALVVLAVMVFGSGILNPRFTPTPVPVFSRPPSSFVAIPPPTFGPPPSVAATPPGGIANGGNVSIGLDLPLSGDASGNIADLRNGVQLAIDQFNSGVGPIHVQLVAKDDAVGGAGDPSTGANNAATLTTDASVMGMVGPYSSNVARLQIPITNQAGLAQCSPTNAGNDLTLDGSGNYRYLGQDQRNYFRVVPPRSVHGTAMASFVYQALGRSAAYVMNGTDAESVAEANAFVTAFELLGGQVTAQVTPSASAADLGDQIASAHQLGSDVVYAAVAAADHLALIRGQMLSNGMFDAPLATDDTAFDDGYLSTVGATDANNTFATSAQLYNLPASSFDSDFLTRFGTQPGALAVLGYACTKVLLQAIDATSIGGPDLATWREAIRAYILDDNYLNSYDTPLGTIAFDANGDLALPQIAFWQLDPTANEGAGGWVFDRQDVVQP